MSRLQVIWSLAVLISLTSAAHGDLAPGRGPLPKPPLMAPVHVVEGIVDDNDPNVVAKIVIPSSLLPELNDASHTVRDPNDFDTFRTIIAGLLLTAFAISLMFVGKTNPHWTKGAAGLIVCILLVSLVLLMNFFSPAKVVAPVPSNPKQRIVIEVQKEGHEVILVLPRGN